MQTVVTMVQGIDGDADTQCFKHLFRQHSVSTAVTATVQRGYEYFQQTLPDAELLRVLNAQFINDPHGAFILAQAATMPAHLEWHITHLAHTLQVLASHIAQHRCWEAARLLFNSIHTEIAAVRELVEIVDDLRPTSDFAPQLVETLKSTARAVANELDHRYITSTHLLHALAALPDGIALALFRQIYVPQANIKAALRRCVETYRGDAVLPQTPDVTLAFDDARKLACQRNTDVTRDEHILDALLAEVECGGKGSTTVSTVLGKPHLTNMHLCDALARSAQIESPINSFASLN